ncbi:MAG: hypothetical protein QW514_07930 [Thermoprotei archaeon]
MPYRFDVGRFIAIVLSMIVLFVLFVFGGFYGGYPGVGLNTDSLLLLVSLIIFAFAVSFVRVAPQDENVDIVSESRCPACGFVYTRPFVNGDFITKQDKPCPKDGTTTLIEKIYVNDQLKQPA